MKIRLKLFALLGKYLPPGAEGNEITMDVAGSTTPAAVIAGLNLPPQYCQLVLVNGVYVAPSDRAIVRLKEGDHLAIWPPIAGG